MTKHRAVATAIAVTLVLGACSSDVGSPGSTRASTEIAEPSGTTQETTVAPTTEPRSENSEPARTGYETCWTGTTDAAAGEIRFADGTAAFGLESALVGMRGHAAAWGDLQRDGLPDLIVGTFATARSDVYAVRGASGPSPDLVLTGSGSTFQLMDDVPEQYGRTSGAAMVDLNGDGLLDVVLSRNVNGRDDGAATAVFANDGEGLTVVDSGIDPELGGRSVGVVDFDQDNLLDLLIIEDRYRGGSSQLYRNTGDYRFENVTGPSGFPADVHGLGVAVGDLNNDGLSDIFVAGSNRTFLGTGSGFIESEDVIPEWTTFGDEDDVSGAAIADVNRDGWLDLLVGHHYNSTLRGAPVPVRLYVNTTSTEGESPSFDDVTEQAGLVGLPTKAPHVELADLNNDGWPDVVTSASADAGASPAVFVHEGVTDGLPTFAAPSGLGDPQYWVSGPTADVDRDGRLDLLGVEWNPSLPSILFMNDSASGHWLEVSVNDAVGGVGSRVEVYEAGRAGEPDALLGARDITATVGYTAGVELHAHFGIGAVELIDVMVTPHAGEAQVFTDVAPDQHIRVGGCV